MKTLNRELLIEKTVQAACDGIGLEDLLAWYYDTQVEYMESLNDEELIEHLHNTTCSEVEDYMEEDDVK